jgi:hypothetical protein
VVTEADAIDDWDARLRHRRPGRHQAGRGACDDTYCKTACRTVARPSPAAHRANGGRSGQGLGASSRARRPDIQIVFPVLGPVSYGNGWGAPRDGAAEATNSALVAAQQREYCVETIGPWPNVGASTETVEALVSVVGSATARWLLWAPVKSSPSEPGATSQGATTTTPASHEPIAGDDPASSVQRCDAVPRRQLLAPSCDHHDPHTGDSASVPLRDRLDRAA